MKIYTVLRHFKTRTGAVLQSSVRSYQSESKAKSECDQRQAELSSLLDGLIVMEMPDGSGRSTGITVGQLLSDLGFTEVSHKVAWAEASDIDQPASQKLVLVGQ